MTYEKPAFRNNVFALAAWTAIIGGTTALPFGLAVAYATLAYVQFYKGLGKVMLLIATGALPLSAVASVLLGQRALAVAFDQERSTKGVAWLCAAWAAMPSCIALYAAVSTLAAP